MKIKKIAHFFIFSILFLCGTNLSAQDYSDYLERAQDYSDYLERAQQRLNEGNCVKAQENYDLWKSFTKKTDPSIERDIAKCSTYLDVTPVSLQFSYSGGTQTITVSTNAVSYSVTDLPKWCSVVNKTGGSFQIVCQPYPERARRDWFTVKSNSMEVTVYVNQDAAPPPPTPTPTPTPVNLSPKGKDVKNRNGNIFLISGICSSAGGVFILAKQPFDKQEFYIGGDGNEYYRYRNEKLNDAVGIGLSAAGVGMMVTGIVLKAKGKNLINKSVTSHNKIGGSQSSVEWKFDFTGNGIRLAVNF